jgi:hypothetical protein
MIHKSQQIVYFLLSYTNFLSLYLHLSSNMISERSLLGVIRYNSVPGTEYQPHRLTIVPNTGVRQFRYALSSTLCFCRPSSPPLLEHLSCIPPSTRTSLETLHTSCPLSVGRTVTRSLQHFSSFWTRREFTSWRFLTISNTNRTHLHYYSKFYNKNK